MATVSSAFRRTDVLHLAFALAVVVACRSLETAGAQEPRSAVKAPAAKDPSAEKAAAEKAAIVEALIEELPSEAAFRGLESLGMDAVPHLTAALRTSGSDDRRQHIIAALGRLEEKAREATPLLASLLKDKNALLRIGAAEALGKIGPAARAALPEMIQALRGKDDESGFHEMVREALVRVGPSDMRQLLTALKDPAPELREQIAAVLGNVGVDATDAKPELLRMIKQDKAVNRRVVGASLLRIDPDADEVLSAFVAALADEDTEFRDFAALALRRQSGPGLTAVLPGLLAALKSEDGAVREEAALIIGSMGEAAEPAVAPLIKALSDKKEGVRLHAAKALSGVGRAAMPAIKALTRVAREDGVMAVRTQAARAIGRILSGDSTARDEE